MSEDQKDDIIISADGLTKKFGNEIGVHDISFEIPRGKVLGFIGPGGLSEKTAEVFGRHFISEVTLIMQSICRQNHL